MEAKRGRLKTKKVLEAQGQNKTKSYIPNYPLLLDLLADSLCIWRSIGSVSEGPEEEPTEQKLILDKAYDHLSHFCVEAVFALYKKYIFRNGDDKLTIKVMPLNPGRNTNQSTENVGID